MGWQLIYTSAPRLLEAGRSGFGTVARHEVVSPLLVGAVEGVSQFSRLPGLDIHRVIYCHRLIIVGGQRYHVLSRICDSGADYTGRTNHLAHHLIFDQREIASANGLSPADVILSAKWRSRWDEAPRFLQSDEEIGFQNIQTAVHLPAAEWGKVTGDRRYAALLVTPESSRGCFVGTTPLADSGFF
jgi:hypothetical protein